LALVATSVFAISATRIGPVSTYGELKAKNGQLVGSCPQYASTAVQVKGMSLFWSSGNTYSTDFYSEKGINRMVDDMGIEVVRFALGAADEKFNSSGRSYTTGGEAFQKAMLKAVVNASIEKDIYVIIDWHIESSSGFTSDAVKFFEYAAKEYGSYNNVIFEIWNEPTGDMNTVKNHADQVIPVIRKYSDNLILVGSPGWSSQPDVCANAGISDNNYGCTLHFYAATHRMGGYDKAAESAMNKGIPVFATEWGTVNANGDGGPDLSSSQSWVNWMSQKKISWTNWNASAMDETSAAFSNALFDNGFTYTASGSAVKGYIGSAPAYSDCGLQNGSDDDDSEFSTGVTPGTQTSMIDDVEDGDRYSYIGGWWNAFEDNADGGASSISNSKITDDFSKQTYDVVLKAGDGTNTSKNMVGLKDVKLGVGSLSYGPYVALGLNLKKDTTVYADFAKCTTIRYKFKGASHNFRIETSDVTDYNYHRVNKDASEGWKEVEITIDMLKQETWGNDAAPQKPINLAHAQRLAWEIKGLEKIPDNLNQPKYNYLYIDDLSCDGLSITAIGSTPTSSSSINNSSSSNGVSSSSIIPPSSSSQVIEPSKVILVLDDVEDADEILKTEGTWYAYTESEVGGLSTITNTFDATLPGYVVSLTGTTDPSNGTLGFVGLNGIVWNQGTYAEAPFVALGLNTMADTSTGLDMSACGAITYRYKGSAHTIKVQDGSVTDYAYHSKDFLDAAEWTTVMVPWASLKQPSWTKDPKELNKQAIKKMAWEVIGYKGFDTQPTLNYLFVDDVTCVEYTQGIRLAKVNATGIKLFADGLSLNVTLAKAGFTRVQVFDMVGNVVSNMSDNMTAGTHQVSLEKLSRGNYVVRVQSGHEMKTTRVAIR
jgi:endoglucanase